MIGEYAKCLLMADAVEKGTLSRRANADSVVLMAATAREKPRDAKRLRDAPTELNFAV
jgi:hypothetical protein